MTVSRDGKNTTRILRDPSPRSGITARGIPSNSVRIGITYNLKGDLPPELNLVEDAAEELDRPETVEALREVLAGEGHEVFLLGGGLSIIQKIRERRIEFVFNIAEGFQGRCREAHVPAVLELLGVPYSGSDPLGLALTLDKILTKQVALSLGIPTPAFWVVEGATDLQKIPGRFPLFVKPAWEGSSKGIRDSSKVENAQALKRELERLLENYPEVPILVEEYITGSEVTVGVLGNHPPEVLGVMEMAFRDSEDKDFCYSLEVKRDWRERVEYFVPTRLGMTLEKTIGESALRLFRELRLRDVARFDFRVNREEKFFFLEANPLPGLHPESGDLVILAQKKGWNYRNLIQKILQVAGERYPRLEMKSGT